MGAESLFLCLNSLFSGFVLLEYEDRSLRKTNEESAVFQFAFLFAFSYFSSSTRLYLCMKKQHERKSLGQGMLVLRRRGSLD